MPFDPEEDVEQLAGALTAPDDAGRPLPTGARLPTPEEAARTDYAVRCIVADRAAILARLDAIALVAYEGHEDGAESPTPLGMLDALRAELRRQS